MIYYIYKVRRKQTSIRFSRSALPHRYLRCISWISWNGHRPPQAGFPPSVATARGVLRRHAYTQGRDSYAPTSTPPGGQANTPPIFPQNNPLPFFRAPLVCRSSCVALPASSSRAAHDPSAAGPSLAIHIVSAAAPQTKKMRARGIAPRTRSPKKRRLLAQESTRRHAWLTRSCFGRKNLFIDGPHSLPPFFLSPFLQRKRKKKTEANSAGSNTSLGLTSFVLTMYAIGPSRLVR